MPSSRQKPDPRRMDAWVAMLHAYSLLTKRLGRELEAEQDMPLAWYDVLIHLNAAPHRRLRMQELAGASLFDLSLSGLSRLIDRMEAAGLVERVQCESDKRGYFAALTDTGKERLRAASTVHLRGIQRHFGRHLSDADADAVAVALRKVCDALV
jgi:DNA-binding MarR family transcriptional regulator